jgi:hypothetical protein
LGWLTTGGGFVVAINVKDFTFVYTSLIYLFKLSISDFTYDIPQ